MATFTGTFDDDQPHTASHACMPAADRQRATAALLACVVFGLGCFMPAREATAQAAHNQPTGAFDGWVAGRGIQIVAVGRDGSLTEVALVRREPGWTTIPVALPTTRRPGGTGRVAVVIQNRPAGEFADFAAMPGVQVVTGKFDFDLETDLGLIRREPGWTTIPVLLSNLDRERFTLPPQNRPASDFALRATRRGVQLVTGYFNGDGRTDLALVQQTPGSTTIPVALSTDTGFTVRDPLVNHPPDRMFADRAATPGIKVITGDFDCDGRTDIGLVSQRPGLGGTTIPVALARPLGNDDIDFSIENREVGEFAIWAAMPGVQVVTGNFDSERSCTDIALVRREPGWNTVPVLLSTRTGFILPPQNRQVGEFAMWAAMPGVQLVTGDFDADNVTDLALVRRQPGWTTIPVLLSNIDGEGFTLPPQNRPVGEFAEWAATPGVQLITGEFGSFDPRRRFANDPDGRTDIALINQTPGWTDVRVALSTSQGFTIQRWELGEFAEWAARGGATQHRLSIRRFGTASLFKAEADNILADAFTVLQLSDAAGDVACNVTFSRDGDVIPFATGTGTITSQADFDAVEALPGRVKIVNQISWCGVTKPNFGGCARQGTNSFVVVRFPTAPTFEGIAWAHEFGHNQNLPDTMVLNAVMNGSGSVTNRQVN